MLRLTNARPHIRITAIDGSAAIIQLAQEAVRGAGPRRPDIAVAGVYSASFLMSAASMESSKKCLLHHLPDPMVLWGRGSATGKAGAVIYVMDLIGPATPERARHIVETVTPDEHPI